MRLKKLMAVACAAALTVTAFAGCSKKNDSSSGSDSKGDAKKEYYNAQPVDTGWEWGNVEIVDGGFIPDVIYNPTEEGLIYARTDMGGAYKYNKDTQRWECITDCFGGDDWNYLASSIRKAIRWNILWESVVQMESQVLQRASSEPWSALRNVILKSHSSQTGGFLSMTYLRCSQMRIMTLSIRRFAAVQDLLEQLMIALI